MGCYFSYCFEEFSRAETGVTMQNCICINNTTIGIFVLAIFFAFIMVDREYWTGFEALIFLIGGFVTAIFISNFF
jgi:hypothetical protein